MAFLFIEIKNDINEIKTIIINQKEINFIEYETHPIETIFISYENKSIFVYATDDFKIKELKQSLSSNKNYYSPAFEEV